MKKTQIWGRKVHWHTQQYIYTDCFHTLFRFPIRRPRLQSHFHKSLFTWKNVERNHTFYSHHPTNRTRPRLTEILRNNDDNILLSRCKIQFRIPKAGSRIRGHVTLIRFDWRVCVLQKFESVENRCNINHWNQVPRIGSSRRAVEILITKFIIKLSISNKQRTIENTKKISWNSEV